MLVIRATRRVPIEQQEIFIFATVLSVPLRFTDFDYRFGIFKLFRSKKKKIGVIERGNERSLIDNAETIQ